MEITLLSIYFKILDSRLKSSSCKDILGLSGSTRNQMKPAKLNASPFCLGTSPINSQCTAKPVRHKAEFSSKTVSIDVLQVPEIVVELFRLLVLHIISFKKQLSLLKEKTFSRQLDQFPSYPQTLDFVPSNMGLLSVFCKNVDWTVVRVLASLVYKSHYTFLKYCKRGWKVREWILHKGLISRVIPFKLFLNMVPNCSAECYLLVAWMFLWNISTIIVLPFCFIKTTLITLERTKVVHDN